MALPFDASDPSVHFCWFSDSRKQLLNRSSCGSCIHSGLRGLRNMNTSERKRLAKRKRSTFSKSSVRGKGSVMDPEVWGTLQHHINLAENVYMRLPLREFFQLRAVCKDWNYLALQRRCPSERIHKPYFAIAHPVTIPFIPYHGGILTFHVSSGQWKWNQLPCESNQLNPLCQPFSVKGIILGARNEVFKICDVHAKRCIGCIYLPRDENFRLLEMERFRTLGMAVDTSVFPHTFKLILGGPKTNTAIYDSAKCGHKLDDRYTWETRPSRMLTPTSKRWIVKSCIHCQSDVYIWSQMDKILVYSLTEDIWSTLDPPRLGSEDDRVIGALGYWNGRLFLVMADEDSSLVVWELVSRSEQRWRKFTCIPAAMQSWVVPRGDDERKVFASFCDEHVLVHTLLGRKAKRTGIGKNIVLFNLATKYWENTYVGSYGVEPKRRLWEFAKYDLRYVHLFLTVTEIEHGTIIRKQY